jgi:hypothetical protein
MPQTERHPASTPPVENEPATATTPFDLHHLETSASRTALNANQYHHVLQRVIPVNHQFNPKQQK